MGRAFPRRVVAGAIALGVSLAVVIALSGILVPAGQRTALGASITVTVLSGEPSARVAGADFTAIGDGTVLRAGDVIRTGPDTRAILTYFEGSTVSIEPGTELVIDEASFGDEGATIIRMTQAAGRTWHVVTKLLRSGSRYEVRTPVSTATVRGTAFEVDVQETTGETTVVTVEGAVATSDTAGTTEVVVTPGQQTTVKVNEPPSAPVKAPEPARKVSVQVDSASSMVVDALGRMNGVKDGKVLLQTPGATIERGPNGILVILPNVSDARVASVSGGPAAEVRTVTTVQDRGAEAVRTEATVRREPAPAPTAAHQPTNPTTSLKGSSPSESRTSLAGAPSPAPTARPSAPAHDGTDERNATTVVAPTAAPEPSRTPAPSVTEKPRALEATNAPEPTKAPVATKAPDATRAPAATEAPVAAAGQKRNTDDDDGAKDTQPSPTPAPTKSPEKSKGEETPAPTPKPEPTAAPSAPGAPKAAETAKPTVAPQPTATAPGVSERERQLAAKAAEAERVAAEKARAAAEKVAEQQRLAAERARIAAEKAAEKARIAAGQAAEKARRDAARLAERRNR